MDWHSIIFSEGKDLGIIEIAVRTALIFIITLFLIRMAKKRFLGKNTAFDVVLGVIIGSVISRAINGSAPLIQTVIAVIVMISLHWIISAWVTVSDKFANLVEGNSKLLVRDGKVLYDNLRKNHFRENDILEAARLKANINIIENIKEARVEANGEISIVKKNL